MRFPRGICSATCLASLTFGSDPKPSRPLLPPGKGSGLLSYAFFPPPEERAFFRNPSPPLGRGSFSRNLPSLPRGRGLVERPAMFCQVMMMLKLM
jgi:hypothetical protein